MLVSDNVTQSTADHDYYSYYCIHHKRLQITSKYKGSLCIEAMVVHIKSMGYRSHLNPTALVGYHCY